MMMAEQLELSYQPPRREPRYPRASQEQLWTLLGAFNRGERLTPLLSITNYGIYALSQRYQELRDLGWPIRSQKVVGKSYHEYWFATLSDATEFTRSAVSAERGQV